jgi:hypothetical protein
VAQIISITSEALQATIRRLLPSQQGFGEDLQASNVITPIIDLTPTSEGSQLPVDLARAISFDGITEFSAVNSTATIANSPGFYRIFGTVSYKSPNSTANGQVQISNGLSGKFPLLTSAAANSNLVIPFDFTVFLDTGESVSALSDEALCEVSGTSWQIADRYGNINNPSGFTFE